jgi:hypothetical protein
MPLTTWTITFILPYLTVQTQVADKGLVSVRSILAVTAYNELVNQIGVNVK